MLRGMVSGLKVESHERAVAISSSFVVESLLERDNESLGSWLRHERVLNVFMYKRLLTTVLRGIMSWILHVVKSCRSSIPPTYGVHTLLYSYLQTSTWS